MGSWKNLLGFTAVKSNRMDQEGDMTKSLSSYSVYVPNRETITRGIQKVPCVTPEILNEPFTARNTTICAREPLSIVAH